MSRLKILNHGERFDRDDLVWIFSGELTAIFDKNDFSVNGGKDIVVPAFFPRYTISVAREGCVGELRAVFFKDGGPFIPKVTDDPEKPIENQFRYTFKINTDVLDVYKEGKEMVVLTCKLIPKAPVLTAVNTIINDFKNPTKED